MIRRQYSPTTVFVARLILVIMSIEMVCPVVTWALTNGPKQPEFQAFEPLGTTGMVNEFTGGFTYNLPVLEVPGPQGSSYPVNLAYHSGSSLEEDASWVGAGWSLNTGAINRSVRGFPDDHNNVGVEFINKQPPSETWMIGYLGNAQAYSFDFLKYDAAVRYNSFTGYSLTAGVSFQVANMLALSYRHQNGTGRFSFSPVVSWASIFSDALTTAATKIPGARGATSETNADEKARPDRLVGQLEQTIYSVVGSYLQQSFSTTSSSYVGNCFTGEDVYVQFTATADFTPIPGVVGLNGGIMGQYSSRRSALNASGETHVTFPTAGYMYQRAPSTATVMRDYAMVREESWTSRDRYIFPGYQQYDIFSCNAQGIGGGMRMLNKRPGFYGPPNRSGSMGKFNAGLEPALGPGEIAIGAKITFGTGAAATSNLGTGDAGEWTDYNNPHVSDEAGQKPVLRFQGDAADNAVYSETDAPKAFTMASGVLSVGIDAFASTDNNIYKYLNNASSSYSQPKQSSSVLYKTNAELMRKDGITSHAGSGRLENESLYLNRLEADVVGDPDSRQKIIGRGIGEISVTNNAGVRYVYGLPVYARNEAQLTYIGKQASWARIGNSTIGLAEFSPTTAEGVVGSYRKAPYATSFLLTEVHTPDYVDRLKDGPTTDDFGGYTSFSYRRAAGTVLKNIPNTKDSVDSCRKWFRWRTPYKGYSLGTGSLSLNHDDRALVSTGEKELYYLSKIETKTHVAIFITNKTKCTLNLTGGRTLVLNGSGTERYDAYEAFNNGKLFEDDKESGWWTGIDDLLPSVDNSWNATMEVKRLGGRDHDKAQLLTQAFVNSKKRTNKSEYLERIVLVPRSAADDNVYEDPLQTVNFEYDYETMKTYPSRWIKTHKWDSRLGREVLMDTVAQDTIYGIAGSLNSALAFTSEPVDAKYMGQRMGTKRYGKLTLKRMWTDYGIVKSPSIRPYEFQYTYRRMASQPYASGVTGNSIYDAVDDFDAVYERTGGSQALSDRYTNGVQNPEYDALKVDAWGSYRRDGNVASALYRDHIDQRKKAGLDDFDPAAWQLKIIRLPTGGEIHVHYEQNTYSYVQDQPALAMVALKDFSMDGDKTVCTVDMSGLPGRDVDHVAKLIKDYVSKERLYFKFLYPLIECGAASDAIDAKTMEWITGYATVNPADVTVVGSDIQIKLTGKPTPQELMKEFVYNKRMGVVSCPTPASPGNSSIAGRFLSGDATSKATFLALVGMAGLIDEAITGVSNLMTSPSYEPVLSHSFLRIPCQFKYGGGIRVKRIFLYDQGAEEGAAALYGNEYYYEAANGESYGVATNEPGSLREENALTRFMVGRNEPTFIEKLGAGEDLEQFEGPFLSSAYPGPSVGYARVVISPLVATPTAPGYTIIEFNTARDYPLKESNTKIETQSKGIPPIPLGVFSISKQWTAATQGHALVLNSMHGRTKSVKKCRGVFSPSSTSHDVVEETSTEYYKPGDAIPVLIANPVAGTASIVEEQRGVERDVTMTAWKNEEIQDEISLKGDFGVQLPFQFYGHCTGLSVNISANTMTTGVISKVTTYATFENRTVVRRDGRTIVSENVAFDGATGQPVITRVYDEYDDNVLSAGTNDGSITSFTIPAWAKYAGMGQASINQGFKDASVVWSPSGSNITVTSIESGLTATLVAGDLICLYKNIPTSTNGQYYYVNTVSSTSLTGTRAYLVSGSATTFGDTTGCLEVVRSGRTNQLAASAGSVVTSGRAVTTSNPWDFTTNSSSNRFVLSSSMTTWSDQWSYDEELYGSALYDAYHVSDYDKATRGKWRPSANWTWRSTTADIASVTPQQAGRANTTYTSFVHLSPPTGTDTMAWIRPTRILGYTQHGEAAYESNALGIPSSARFSHRGMVPSIVAKNAEPGSVVFLSFEDVTASTSKAHTGKRSLEISSSVPLCTLNVTNYLRSSGVLVRFWASSSSAGPTLTIGGVSAPDPVALSSVHGWTLYEIEIPPSHSSIASNGSKSVAMGATSSVFIDDMRVQPTNASATCYVYDNRSLLLLASFDDQHFASLYRYDNEGQLKRKERETERGIFPIAEAHYNAPSITYATRSQAVVGVAPMMMQPQMPGFSMPWNSIEVGRKLEPGRNAVKAQGKMLDLKFTPAGGSLNLFDRDTIQLPGLIDTVKKDSK